MSKKSALLATLLAGMGAFSGCNEKESSKSSASNEKNIQEITQMMNMPIYVNELPYAMIIPKGKGEYVQLLFPVRKDGMVIESKDQYEKRIKWLNENDLVDPPKGLTLAGCRWKKRTKPSKMPFVSFFDDQEYMYRHIEWQQKSSNLKTSEVIKKDPVVLWWAAQQEFTDQPIQKTRKVVNKRGRDY